MQQLAEWFRFQHVGEEVAAPKTTDQQDETRQARLQKERPEQNW